MHPLRASDGPRPHTRAAAWLALLVAVFAGAFPEASLAQGGSIQGRVIDAETRQPLDWANVTVIGAGRGTRTDREGRYTIDELAPGTYSLEFSYVSYETRVITDVVVKASGPATVNCQMVLAFPESETIDVRPRYFVKEFKSPVSTVDLSQEEIRRYPGGFQDVVRTVTTLPGVALVNEGGRNDLLVRGGGPSENLYRINGIEVPNVNHFGSQGTAGGALSFINLDLIENVEFSTGGFGAAYGDKLSSSLAIELREGRSDRIGGKATLSATQYGLNLEGPLTSRGTFLFSARRSYLDLLFRALGQPFIPIYSDVNAQVELAPSPQVRLSAIALAALDDVERDDSTDENRVVNAGLLDNSQDRWIAGTRLRRLLTSGFIDLSLGFNRVAFDLAQVDTTLAPYFRSQATEQELDGRAEAFLRLTDRLDLRFGGSAKRADVDYRTAFADSVFDRSGRLVPRSELDLPGLIEVDDHVNKFAGWLEAERRFGRRFSASAGLRFDRYDFLERSDYPALRLGLRAFARDRLEFKASYGTYYQAPSYVWIANPVNRGLRALRNDMLILGGDYLVREDLNMTIEFYLKEYDDLPVGATETTSYVVLSSTGVGYGGREDDFQSFGFFPLTSTGSGRAFGIDLTLQKKLSETPFYGLLGLTIGKAEVTAPNGKTYPTPYDQRVIFSVSGGYVPNPRWELSARFQAASGAPYTPVYDPATNGGTIQNLPDEYLGSRLGVTHALDIRIDRRFSFSDWTLIAFADVQNVYNYRAPERPRWDFWERTVIERDELGLFPTIGVSAEF